MSHYIKVAENESEEPIEIPCEADNTILLTTLASLFPCASGLKYRNAESGTMRGLRLSDGKIQAPDEGWPSISVYYCCFPKGIGSSDNGQLFQNKRKNEFEDQDSTFTTKAKRVERRSADLIVLGLAWKTSDKELREYFETFGELMMAQVKKDPKTGFSKGFGFIRFAEQDIQSKVIAKRHFIDGRWCDVRTPLSKDGSDYKNPELNRKIFIGRLTSEVTTEDLQSYFCKYGEINDIFIPKPFRGFAFVTFDEIALADALFGEDHIIKGISIHVSNAVPKMEMAQQTASKVYSRYSPTFPSYPPPPNNNHHSSPVTGPPPPHHTSYSPPATQYDYYARNRPTQQPSAYTEPGNPYHRVASYSSPNYTPYYP